MRRRNGLAFPRSAVSIAAATMTLSPLDSARRKAFRRLLPVLFISYMVAYVDRQNVAVAQLTMSVDLPQFTDAVIGLGAGIFFLGYFLLEIPGSLMVEKWSARKWICRIMITWGFMAGLTGFVHHDLPILTPLSRFAAQFATTILTPVANAPLGYFSQWAASVVEMATGPNHVSVFQFVTVRFFLGLAEAGFFPGVIVYLTHWFTARDRAKALSYFLIATPCAQIVSPKISNWLLKIGTTEVIDGVTVVHPLVLGMAGWQWVYVFWAIPAVVLGVAVLWLLTDRPRHAKWLTTEEREALENALEEERLSKTRGRRMTFFEALIHPKVLLLALAYFCIVTCSYSIEFFMPRVINDWYDMSLNKLTWLIILPPMLALAGQLFGGWSSDHFQERRLHACLPIVIGAIAIACAPLTQGNLTLTIICFMVAFAGFKTYMPAFWSLPSLFLTQAAAAGSIGLINSIGNLGGFFGPNIMGWVRTTTGSFSGALYFLCGSMLMSATIIFFLGLGARKPAPPKVAPEP